MFKILVKMNLKLSRPSLMLTQLTVVALTGLFLSPAHAYEQTDVTTQLTIQTTSQNDTPSTAIDATASALLRSNDSFIDEQLLQPPAQNQTRMRFYNSQIRSQTGGGTAGDGGGGKGIVCRNERGEVTSVQTLDLYEGMMQAEPLIPSAKMRDNVSAIETVDQAVELLRSKDIFNPYTKSELNNWSMGDPKFDYLKSISDLGRMIYGRIESEKKYGRAIGSHPIRLFRNTDLMLTEDSFELTIPKNCAPEQIANYRDNKGTGSIELYINLDLFEKMNPINQAALILHEGIYKLLRDYSNEKNSLRTRRLVALTLSSNFDHYVGTSLKLKTVRYVTCESERPEWDEFDNSTKGVSQIHIVEDKLNELSILYPVIKVLDGNLQLGHYDSQSGGMVSTLEKLLYKDPEGSSTGGRVIKTQIEKEEEINISFGRDEKSGRLKVWYKIKNMTNGSELTQGILKCSRKIHERAVN